MIQVLVVGENVPSYQAGRYKELALVADRFSTCFVSRRKSIHRALSSSTDCNRTFLRVSRCTLLHAVLIDNAFLNLFLFTKLKILMCDAIVEVSEYFVRERERERNNWYFYTLITATAADIFRRRIE